MARAYDYIVILDDKKDIDNIEVGMCVAWVDRQEGIFGFDHTNFAMRIWYKFLHNARKLARR